MNNIGLITAREYSTRVKKKSFILMTLLTPLIIAAFYGVIIWVSIGQSSSVEKQNIVVVDKSGVFDEVLQAPDNVVFIPKADYTIKELLATDTIDAIVTIAQDYTIGKPLSLTYESMSSLSVNNNERIESAFERVIRDKKLTSLGVSQSALDSLQSSVSINQVKVDENGDTKSSNIVVNSTLGMILSMMIYFFIFLYGVQVMKGVIEEKTNRIVELIVSTVKPFQLMLGKVLGIALVGLTQLTIWMLLSGILMSIIGLVVGFNFMDMEQLKNASQNQQLANMDMLDALTAFRALPLLKIFMTFLFYFIGGYLFYGALFAAIGSAVDNETDTQQFMLPITMPLVFSIAISFSLIAGDPHGTLATWMSMIPLTSPIVMMVRMPFDPAPEQILLSMAILIATIVGVIWMAGKIYRTGILMYGKKPTYKELAKWLFYKN